ncbi:glycosyltransferase family 4 protein [Oceanobacillus profundus]|uniref:glycosyltransferase family 4 protein n=1 Tax=Oceanobacillus profundus TaxID=372463 RepID=UPI0020400A78|nr:glycosyltransferase family 4 protein [Oceanobacillus profundus]MCM3399457.1 glycosyltransferase family 4 protein [Oceanobacillus profundus]
MESDNMNILLITTLYPGYEGQSRSEVSYALHQFAKEWIANGHNVQVLRLWPKHPKLINLIDKGKETSKYRKDETVNVEGVDVNIVTINRYPKMDYLEIHKNKALNRILRNLGSDSQPDIIVCHMMNPSLYIAKKLKEILNVPLVFTIHQTDIKQLANMSRRLKEFLILESSIDKLGFRSDTLMEQYNELSLPNKSMFVINSGIETKLIMNGKKLKEKKRSNLKVIFVAANMIHLKNIDIIIKAFEKVAVNRDVYLKIAGEGPEKGNLLKLINESKVKNKIEYLGFITRDSVLQQMEKSTIFALVSSPETFGLVYLEAMAKGCITIGSKGEGIDGVIKDGINGYLCEPRNVNDLVQTINRSLNLDINSKKTIIENAVNTAKSMTQEKMAMEYLHVLKNTINKFYQQ